MPAPQARGGRKGAESKTRREKSSPTLFLKPAAQANFISHIGDGLTIGQALEKVGRTRKTYELWRSEDDSDFRMLVDQAKALNAHNDKNRVKGGKMPFAEFRKRYLKTETFWHQHQWIDILERRAPRDLHPAQTYVEGRPSRILINTPPFHAKSITVTVDYVVYRICMDPSFRVIIVSESQRLAKDFLFGIKQRLTHPDYLDMQLAYAPKGGWKQTAESWKEDRIVVGAGDRDGAEKDPSVQAIGIGGQIYGSRADLVILDDAITGKNVREHEKQMDWIRREVASRIEQGGKLLAIGTRIAATDLYSELMNADNYGGGTVPWTYMASPAILEEGATPDDHVTLWPWTDRPWQGETSEDVCDCNQQLCREGIERDGKRVFPRWDGLHLEIGPRAENSVAGWALVYQQKSMHEEMTFAEHAVMKATNKMRVPGILDENSAGCPPGGMHNMYVIAGCDPSIKGFAGLCVIAFDRATGKRYLLNAYNLKAPTPEQLKNEMKRVTEHFGVQEWRVEKTGLLQFFTQDQAMRQWFAERGVIFREHLTSGSTKWDPTYGVASCAALFGAYDKVRDSHGVDMGDWREIAPPLIELPKHMNNGIKALVHQLVTWTPQLDPKKTPCDQVMALWFAEVGCRELTIQGGSAPTAARFARFSSRSNQKKRFQVNLAELRAGTDQPMNGLLRGA